MALRRRQTPPETLLHIPTNKPSRAEVTSAETIDAEHLHRLPQFVWSETIFGITFRELIQVHRMIRNIFKRSFIFVQENVYFLFGFATGYDKESCDSSCEAHEGEYVSCHFFFLRISLKVMFLCLLCECSYGEVFDVFL